MWAVVFSTLLAVGSIDPGYRVIVHPGNSVEEVSRHFVAQAFLKKISRWPSGQFIKPVDLRPDFLVRKRFVEHACGRSLGAVKSYWQQLIFSGRSVPPPELDSEEAVVRYVLSHPGAIGYVSARVDVGKAKVVRVK